MHNPVVLTTVVTPASTYNLIDLATLKTLLGVSGTASDAYLTALIPIVSTRIAQYCNRVLPAEAVIDQFWAQRDGFPIANRGAAPPVQLTRYPVQTLTSVVETVAGLPTTLVQGTDFNLDPVKAQLTRLDFSGYPVKWQPNLIAVTYTGGLSPIPPDIAFAAAAWIQAMRSAQGRDPALRSQTSPGVFEQTYFGTGAGVAGGMPRDVADCLDNYKSVLIG